jgi:general secretion pathway protein I
VSYCPGGPSRRLCGSHRRSAGFRAAKPCGFTLLEVMIALAVLGLCLTALLTLHHHNLQAVIKTRQMTRAAMLAEGLMSQAELERFPPLGHTSGDFQGLFNGHFPNYRWERDVVPWPVLPNMRQVTVRVRYGPGLRWSLDAVEVLRNPAPAPLPIPGSAAAFGTQ